MPSYLLIIAALGGMAAGAVLVWLALRPHASAAAEAASAAAKADAQAEIAKLREDLIRRDAIAEKLKDLEEVVTVLTAERTSAATLLALEKDQHADARAEIEKQSALRAAATANAQRLQAELTTLRERHEQLQAAQGQLERQAAELRTSLSEREKAIEDQLKLVQQSQEEFEAKLKASFGALTQEYLDKGGRSFLELAQQQFAKQQQVGVGELEQRRQQVEALVKPIGESLGRFNTTVQEIEKQRAEAYGGISTELRALREAQTQLHSKATELTDALRGNPTRWGRWGELQLRNLVELAGMMSYCDFFEQETVAGVDGAKLRPDMLIKLAGGRHIAVDSKAPVELYLAALEQPTEDERQAKLREYAAGVRRHVADLTRKSYWEHVAGSPEFVVMFMPGESFFSAVHIADPTLIEPSAETRVILASPTTLLALLRAVAYGWKQVQLADNARQISDAGAELIKRLRTFVDHLQKVGSGLSSAIGGYNAAVGSLEGRILPQARKMQELGAGESRALPEAVAIELQPRQLSAPELFADGGEA